MGLLSHIEEADYSNKKSASSISFEEFQNKYNIKFFGIFNKTDKTYVLEKSFGFDFETITRMIIDSEVVDELIILENKVYSFEKSENNIIVLFDKFSNSLTNQIRKVYFYKKSDKLYLICTIDDLSYDYKEIFDKALLISTTFSFDSLLEAEEYQNFKFDFNDCIETLCQSCEYEFIGKAIFSQILFDFSLFFPKPNQIRSSYNYQIELAIKAKSNISESLLLTQIKSNLKFLLCDSSDLIKII